MRSLALAACVIALIEAQTSQAWADVTQIYLFTRANDDSPWCAFRDKTAWIAAASKSDANGFGIFAYTDGRLSKVEESGVLSGELESIDDYRIAPDGSPIALNRDVKISVPAIEITQKFSIHNGMAQKLSTRYEDLVTHKATAPRRDLDWAIADPVHTNLQEFPFPIVEERSAIVDGKTCFARKK